MALADASFSPPQHGVLSVGNAEPSDPGALVDIPDAALRRALEEALGKEEDAPITRGDMASLSDLTIVGGVDQLNGLEHAINLVYLVCDSGGVSDLMPLAGLEAMTTLSLHGNDIADIGPLAELRSLTWLGLDGNAISDIAPLAGLEALTSLNLSGNAISNIAPLAGLRSLTWLGLWGNTISNIAPLAGLRSLTWLGLWGNTISDIAPLAGLEALSSLVLGDNAISNITPLAELRSLTWLHLGGNAISDIAPLAGLEALTTLSLDGNDIAHVAPLAELRALTNLSLWNTAIADIAPLAGLEALTSLNLGGNAISDIAPLAGLEALTTLSLGGNDIAHVAPLVELRSLTYLSLPANAISDIAPLAGLEALTSLNLAANDIADVTPLAELRSLTWLGLWNNAISDIAPLAGLISLSELYLNYNGISDIAPLARLISLRELYLTRNGISDIAPLVANDGLGRGDTLALEGNLLSARSLDDDIPTLQERGVEVTFDAPEPLAEGDRAADIPDPAMRTAFEKALIKGAGWEIGVKEIGEITELDARGLRIQNLSGLEHATDLEYLDLGGNAVTDLALLGGLESLQLLYLDGNEVADIAALAELPLAILSLSDTKVDDFSPLSNMDSLYWLALDGNAIRDLPPLPASLWYLYLTNNAISDIGVLADLPNLREVRLSGNAIRSLAPLAGLSRLEHVFLNDNRVRVLAPLNLESLVELHLRNNAVRSIESLRQGRLAMVDVRGNPLAEASTNVHAPALREDGTRVLMGRPVPYFPAAGGSNEGFVRVVNRSGASGDVFIEAADDAGVRFGPERLRLGARRVLHFDSGELQDGHAAKGFAGIGPPTVGDWRLEVASALDIEVLSYVRAEDGLVTPMHDIAREAGHSAGGLPSFGVFDSAEGGGSILRVVNTEVERARWTTGGYDDRGRWRAMANAFVLPGGSALTFTAEQLANAHGLREGSWQLRVRGFPWFAQNLYMSPTGHLANLSTAPANSAELLADGTTRHRVPFLPAAAGPYEGLVRVVNRSAEAGVAAIEATDDEGNRFGPGRLPLRPRQAVLFSSADLEHGNDAKGLAGVVGPGEGDWRLTLTSALDLQVLSYVRSEGGLVSAMHDLAPVAVDSGHRVVYFNPASNRRHVSKLRLANDGEQAAAVTITGLDDRGAQSGAVTLAVPAMAAATFTSAQLEAGGEGLAGSLGDGYGKWRLRVESDVPLAVMSLVESRDGHLVNVSTGTAD